MPDSRKRLADGAFLLALMLYILAGVASVPVHGDEFMQMSMAHDVFSMARGDWNRLVFTPPIQPDTDQALRLYNGTVNKTLIGLTWLLSGRSESSLPGIYAWANSLDWNQQQGNVPSVDDLRVARLPSAILTALGVIPLFMLGWQLRLRSLAYPAALLYALHPVILLNGRRAMMEGSLIFFSLATMCWLVALVIAEHSATAHGFVRRLPMAVRYVVLGLLIGLTVASKQTGIAVALAAIAAILAAGFVRDHSWRPLAWAGLTGAIGLITWFALNPGYWNDPVGTTRAVIAARSDLLTQQTSGTPLVYTDFGQRVAALAVEPFMLSPQYYEAPTWNGLIDDQIAAYQTSSVDGWDWWGTPAGLIMTLLSGIGLLTLFYDALHRDLVARVILIWAGVVALTSLVIPLNWQRYYLPLLLVAILLAATGLGRLLIRRRAEEPQSQPAIGGAPAV